MKRQKMLNEVGSETLLWMYRCMLEIRGLEEKVRDLFLEGEMPGTIHQYIGMEACAVGVCAALEEGDVIASTHRPNGHAVAKGLSLKSILAELYGKTTGCCRGKGGAMHIGDITKGMLPAIAVVAANIPIIVGVALSFKMREKKHVAVSFFGDGASNQGAFHEALNMAAVYQLPALFVCENNHYAASTSIIRTLKIEHIADRAAAYGMAGTIADGMDVLDVYSKAKIAVDQARRGEGPTLLELKTFRFCGHSRRDPGNYVRQEEKERWKRKDPIPLFETALLQEGVADRQKIEEIAEEVEQELNQAIEYGRSGPDPQPEDTYKDLYATMEVPR